MNTALCENKRENPLLVEDGHLGGKQWFFQKEREHFQLQQICKETQNKAKNSLVEKALKSSKR